MVLSATNCSGGSAFLVLVFSSQPVTDFTLGSLQHMPLTIGVQKVQNGLLCLVR